MPGCNTAPYKRLQRVLCCQCNYTAHATKQRTRLYSCFSCDFARSTAHDNRPTQAAIIPPAPRWRAYTRPEAFNRYQIPPPRRTLHRPAQAAYYNKVYKRAGHASPAAGCLAPGQRSGRAVWHPPPGGAVQQQRRGERRGTIGGSRRISFRAFAR